MKNELFVVGAGPGAPDCLTAEAYAIIDGADCVVAAPRNLNLARGRGRLLPLKDFSETFEKIEEELKKGSVAVLVSGDPCMYSLLPLLKKKFGGTQLKVIPGISSLQSLCCEAGVSWEDALILSGHGRQVSESQLLTAADRNGKIIFFCGADKSPAWVCQTLAAGGHGELEVVVGERLSYRDQRISCGSPSLLARRAFDPLSVVLIRNSKPWTPSFNRLRDEDFIRSQIPMTKSEVRSLILDRLELTPDAVFWDIGAGTGSISISAALMCPAGEVHAIESDPCAVELEKQNKEKFHCFNMKIYQGRCPAVMEYLPRPTHIFIGGSGGALKEILESAVSYGKGIRVVVSAVSLQTMSVAADMLRGPGFTSLDVTQLAVNKSKIAGNSKIMVAQNPITVFSAWTTGEERENTR